MRDERPLVQLDGGGAEGGLISSPEGFAVSSKAQVTSRGLRIQDAPTDQPPLAIYRGDRAAWAVAPDGVHRHQPIQEHPTRPAGDEVRTYVKAGSLWVQDKDGETELGAGGGGGGDVDEIVVASPLTGGGTGTVNIGLGTVPISKGGTGATTAAGARTNFSLEPGVDIQEWSAALDDFAAATGMDGQVLTWDTGGFAWMDLPGGAGLDVEEEDGTPSVTASVVKVPNGTLTDNGGGSVSLNYQKGHANLTALSGLGFASDQMLYLNDAGALALASITTAIDDLFDLSGVGERWLLRTGSTWQAVSPTTNSVLGVNGSGGITQHAASANQAILARNAAGTLGFTGALNVTSTNGTNSGFAQIESTGNATSGSFQLNVDMVTTSSAIAGAESALALQIDNATQNKFKIRADGSGGFDIFIRNISGTTSNHWYDASANVWEFGAALRMINQSAPTTPAAGSTVLWAKTGALVTWKGSAGTENTGVVPTTLPSAAANTTATFNDVANNPAILDDAATKADVNVLVAQLNQLKTDLGTFVTKHNDTRTAALGAGWGM